MTYSFLARLINHFVAPRYTAAARLAEAEALESRLELKDATEVGDLVEDQATRMAADRQRNHYADRVANAWGREHA